MSVIVCMSVLQCHLWPKISARKPRIVPVLSNQSPWNEVNCFRFFFSHIMRLMRMFGKFFCFVFPFLSMTHILTFVESTFQMNKWKKKIIIIIKWSSQVNNWKLFCFIDTAYVAIVLSWNICAIIDWFLCNYWLSG